MVKLARKYDPDGIRTLGVVTKCDDAANAEASDIVEKAWCLLDDWERKKTCRYIYIYILIQ